jgi:dienelactone hydrolase
MKFRAATFGRKRTILFVLLASAAACTASEAARMLFQTFASASARQAPDYLEASTLGTPSAKVPAAAAVDIASIRASLSIGYTVQDPGAPNEPGHTTEGTGSRVDSQDFSAAYAHAEQLAGQEKGRVFKLAIEPHWYADNSRFWYRNDLAGDTKEFIVVDAVKGTRQKAFDHDKLAAALSRAADAKYTGERLPFQSIEFLGTDVAIRFKVGDKSWLCTLDAYDCTPAQSSLEEPESPPPATAADEQADRAPEALELSPEEIQQKKGQGKGGLKQPTNVREAKSPNMKWLAYIKDFNLWVRDESGKETKITSNGTEGDSYGGLDWSPDSKTLVCFRTTPVEAKTVYLLQSSPPDQLPAKLNERPYPRPGDKLPAHEMNVVDIDTFQVTKVEVERFDFRRFDSSPIPKPRWLKDNRHFTVEKTDRGHQRFRIIEIDAHTGKTRDILDEKAQTMVDHYSYSFLQYLNDTGEILYLSEMDGWKHLYLIDAAAGKIKTQITKGEWVVRKVDRVDPAKRQIWFQASGKNSGQDPYLIHFYRVNFDGTGLVALTEGNGDHTAKFSPDNEYLVDTYSRVDMAPVHELRRTSDGSKVCDLEKADISALIQTGWRFPEVFVAKGRDGRTDIWGIAYRPQKLDPAKTYPVIEYIYAGPHSSHTPKKFAAYRQMAALAELGFIVVQMDGMGTGNRSRAFHDICWKNLADAGFPDRILWIKAFAKQYTYADIERVGIYGTSAGGQNACGALLFHPEFYKVAVASCGCHDNRLDKLSWNEAWMGVLGAHYGAQSNVTNAHKLVGRLLLIVGELDRNVPPESTMRVVDALIKAKKDFDLIVVPGMDHSDGGPHGSRRRMDFFVQHLHGALPPNHNAKN